MLAALVLAALTSGAAARASGDLLVASFDPGSVNVDLPLGANGYNTIQVAEAFTPSQTGTLAHIDLQMVQNNSWGGPGAVEVRVVTVAGGQPNMGNVLAQTIEPAGALPQNTWPVPWFAVHFSPAPTLAAGTTYAFVVTPLAPANGTNLFGNWSVSPGQTWQGIISSGAWYADNRGLATFRVYDVQSDSSAPTTTDDAPAGWVNHDVTVTLTATDPDGSGDVAATHYSLDGGSWQTGTSVNVSGDGTHTLSYYSVDQAGNTESAHSTTVKIDTTPPTITASSSYTSGTWTNTDVVVHYACTDSLSGVAAVSPDATVSSEGADQSVTGTCTDAAGNSASATFGGIDIDKTAPTVTYSGNAGTYTVADTVSITCSASDELSGVASSTCSDISGPAWSFALGTNSFSATATDNAGNSGSGSTSFTVSVDFGSLSSLVGELSTNADVTQGLVDKLAAAKNAAARGQTKTKNNIISAFDKQVDAQTGKALTASQAALLKQLAATL